MKRTKEMFGGCYYLLEGRAAANSVFIETTKDAKLFINLCNSYLGKYMKIHEYLLSKDGWLLHVTLNKKEEINDYFGNNQKSGIRRDEIMESEEEWRVISEQIRKMLCYYVRRTNKKYGREGTKVKQSYRRYFFETHKEAVSSMKAMQNQMLSLHQRNKKYRAVKGHYRIGRKLGKGHVFLCTKKIRRKKFKVGMTMKSLCLLTSKELLALNSIDFTKKSHFSNYSTQNSS